MKNYSIAVRLTMGFCCVLALCVASGMLSWQAMRTMDQDSKLIEEAYMPLIAGASGVEGQVAQSVSNMKDFFTLQHEEDFQAGMASLLKAREYFGGIRKIANEHPKLSGLNQTMNELEKYGEGYIAAARKGADLLHASQAVTAELRTKLDELVVGAIKLQEAQQQMVLDMADVDNRSDLLARMTIFTRITNAIAEARQALLRAMVAGDPELTIELPTDMTKIMGDFAQFAKISDQPWHKEQAATMGALAKECRDLLMRHNQDWNHRLELDAERQELATKLIAAARAMVQEGIGHTTATSAALADSTTAGVRNTLLTTGAALLLALLVAILLTRSITVPVRHCLSFAESVSNGDLSRTLTLDRKDEMGRLGRALNTMVTNLKAKILEADAHSEEAQQKAQEAMVAVKRAEEATKAAENARREGVLSAARQLEEIVDVVSSASDQLSAQIGQSERGASVQSTLVSETATAMEQMNSTVLDVARNAATASDASAVTRRRAEDGADVVRRAVESIRQVQQQSLTLREEMSQLSESARAITQIMGVISDIADQTNLLALNAAIEAARAGEAGRGFAVVADEVRKLAEKTMVSTVDVGNAIRAIQTNAETSMMRMGEAVTTIEQATDLATESGSALGEIVQLMDNAADQVHAIATAAEEQSASSEEIHNSIVKVNTISRETAIAMREATQAVSELSRQSHAMAALITQMKKS